MKLRPLFEEHAAELPTISERELALLETHYDLLRQWNENIGLVSRKSIDLAFANHYADSLFISEIAAGFREQRNVVDLGTGAGFPGLVFAIRYPDVSVVLYEKLLKKQSFLMVAIQTLGLSNVSVSGGMPKLTDEVLVLARAVLPPPDLFRFAEKQLVDGSRIVLNRGGSAPSNGAPKRFLSLAGQSYSLPLGQGSRHIEILELVPRGTKGRQ